MAKNSPKYCFVPKCSNSTIICPDKLFVTVPIDQAVRKKWFLKANRMDGVSSKTKNLHCCQDHFNIKEDLLNYDDIISHGGKMKLRDGAIPHKFDCQVKAAFPSTSKRALKRSGDDAINYSLPAQKRNRKTTKGLNDSVSSNTGDQYPANSLENDALETGPVENAPLSLPNDALQIDLPEKAKEVVSKIKTEGEKYVSVAVQTDGRMKSVTTCSVRVQTDFPPAEASSPLPSTLLPNILLPALSQLFPEGAASSQSQSSSTESSPRESPSAGSSSSEGVGESSDGSGEDHQSYSFEEEDNISSNEDDEEIQDEEWAEVMRLRRHTTRKIYQKYPLRYLGLADHSYQIVGLLSDKIAYRSNILTKEDVISIVLMKIRLNDSFDRLGTDFGISTVQASRIFKTFVPHISKSLKDLVIWPSKEQIRKQLPVAFRVRFSFVQVIIDAFEIEIQKSSNPMNQSLTWSDYKSTNTIKYLIAMTPDGLVIFISKGYCGRISDIELTEVCGFLDMLYPGCCVMADRGFKHVETVLLKKNCKLVRPPSVGQDEVLSMESTIEAKQIASLRAHVERAIRRIREFSFLAPHACTHHQMIRYFDDATTIACALINLQGPLLSV